MNRMPLALLLVLAACEQKSTPKTETETPPSEPAPSATRPPEAPKLELAAGEKLAPAPSGTVNQLAWDTGAGTVLLASVARADGVVLRVISASGSADVTKPLVTGDAGHCWIRQRGDVVFRCEPDAGVLEEHHAQRITWDAKAGAAVVADTWSCKDEDFDRPCEFPAWASDTAPPPPDPDRPTVEASADLVRTWLGAVHANDKAAAAKLMAPDVAVAIDYSEGDEEPGCPAGASTQTAEVAASCAHAILATAKRMKGNVTRDSVTIDPPSDYTPAPHEIYVSVEGNGEQYDTLTVALVQRGGAAQIRSLWMSRSIADE